MLIEIDTVRRRQAEIEAELTSLRANTRAAETPGARLEALKARADVLRTLSLVHARLDRGEPENLARPALVWDHPRCSKARKEPEPHRDSGFGRR